MKEKNVYSAWKAYHLENKTDFKLKGNKLKDILFLKDHFRSKIDFL